MTKFLLIAALVPLAATIAVAQTGPSSARGDVNGDGVADLITGAGAGGGPQVRVVDGASGKQLRLFFAFDAGFTGGVRVAAGDVNGDGLADIIVGAGPGGPPHVKIFDGKSGALLRSWMAFAPGFTGGVRVVAMDQDSDGRADIIVTGGSQTNVFSGATGALLSSTKGPTRGN